MPPLSGHHTHPFERERQHRGGFETFEIVHIKECCKDIQLLNLPSHTSFEIEGERDNTQGEWWW